MTAINQNTNSFLNQIDSMNLTGASASAAANTKSQIEELFGELGTLNEGDEGAKKIDKQIAELEAKIKKLEDKATEIYDDIAEKNGIVKQKSDALAETVTDLTGATGDLREKTKEAANLAAREAIAKFKSQGGNKDGANFEFIYNNAFQKHLGGLQANQSELAALYELYEQQRGGISSIAGEIEAALNQIGGLEGQLTNINATISLLTRTKNVMKQSTVENAYKNIDTDANVPIYSGQKAEVANSILAKFTSRNTTAASTDGLATTGSAEQKAAVMDKYKALKGNAKYTSGDKYSAQSNPELANLRSLYANGMLKDLQNSGMNIGEIMTFISSNWNVGISKNADGTWQIPKGHSSDAWVHEPVYDGLSELIANASKNLSADSVNQNQLAELKKAMNPKDGSKDILTQMYEAGFTFKEAMYTLTQAFPDAGIGYDLNSQSKRNYSMVSDSDASGGVYAKIGTEIKNYWNVDFTQKTEDDSSGGKPAERFDPITFQQNDTTYTFITDRDGDGKFDYTNGQNNELLGSQNGMAELLAYDKDGDGKISGAELDNLLLLANNQDESSHSKNTISQTNSVDFHVSYKTAADLGIKEINLAGIGKDNTGKGDALGNTTKKYDGYQEEYEDINGSSVINTFGVTMNDGTKIEGKETLNTEANLETFYGQIAKDANASRANITLSDDEIAAAFKNAEGKDSAVLRNVRRNLEQMQKDSAVLDSSLYEDPVVTAEQIHNMTGLTYLTGMMDAGRVAAENSAYRGADKAAEDSEKAVDNYWEENVLGSKDKKDNKVEIKKDEDKNNNEH